MNLKNNEKASRPEKVIKKQILTNARKGLAEVSRKRAEQKGGKYEPPTQDQIATECKSRWQKHLDRNKPPEDLSIYFD